MLKILKWFTPLIAAGVAIFIVNFLITINSNADRVNLQPFEHKSSVVAPKPKKVWLDHFSQTQKLGYMYPVNEVLIQVDLNEKIKSKAVYKLSAPILDPYQLFCLKEELGQYKLKYYLQKDKNGMELLIYSKDKKRLNSLVRVLKSYQISANVRLFKEDL